MPWVNFSARETDPFDLVVQAVTCPYCHAPVGASCVSRSSVVGVCRLNHPHEARKVRARKMLAFKAVYSNEPGEPYATPYPPGDERNPSFGGLQNSLANLFEDPEPSDVGLFQIRAPQVEVHGTQTGRVTVSKKQVLEGQLDRILHEIDKLEAIGEDVYEDDTVLSIKVKFPNGDKEYDYIAFKSDGRWYVTGYRNEGPRSWDNLVSMFSHCEIIGIWRVSEWEQVV